MKKKISLLLILVLTVSLSACVGNKPNTNLLSSNKNSSDNKSSSSEQLSSQTSSLITSSTISKNSSSINKRTSTQVKSTIATSEVKETVLNINILNSTTPAAISARNPANSYNECPPVFARINNKLFSFISTGWTNVTEVKSGKSVLTDKDAYESTTTMAVGRDITPPPSFVMKNPNDLDPKTYWRRNYYGVFDASVIKNGSKSYTIAICHGENKNEIINNVKYNNSIKPASTVYNDNQYSGYHADGSYTDDWDNYYAFAGLCLAPTDENNGLELYKYDYGPVVWPSSGYLNEYNTSTSCGVRHPSFYIDNNYIYIYYLDTSTEMSGFGRDTGIKVARAPLSSGGKPGSFMNYYFGSFSSQSLPSGFNKNDKSFLYKKGGKATTILPGVPIKFSVAKIKNSNYYLGVYEQNESGIFSIRLTVSKDLVNWSDPVVVPGTTLDWSKQKLHYPSIYNKTLDDHMNIDASEFYITGTSSRANVYYMKLSVNITEK